MREIKKWDIPCYSFVFIEHVPGNVLVNSPVKRQCSLGCLNKVKHSLCLRASLNFCHLLAMRFRENSKKFSDSASPTFSQPSQSTPMTFAALICDSFDTPIELIAM